MGTSNGICSCLSNIPEPHTELVDPRKFGYVPTLYFDSKPDIHQNPEVTFTFANSDQNQKLKRVTSYASFGNQNSERNTFSRNTVNNFKYNNNSNYNSNSTNIFKNKRRIQESGKKITVKDIAATKIQALFRGIKYRKKFFKILYEKNFHYSSYLDNQKKKEKKSINEEENKSNDKDKDEEFKDLNIKKLFDKPLDYENGWKKYDPYFYSYNKPINSLNSSPEIKICQISNPTQNYVGMGEGFFDNGKLHGLGRFTDSDGIGYEGLFSNGTLLNKATIIKIDNNNNIIEYFGEVENLEKNGYGRENTYEYMYEGYFKNGKKSGEGKINFKLTGDYFEGEFKDGKLNGFGFYKWKNGNNYMGNFSNDKIHGRGLYKWVDGTEYEGDYINNIKEGQGTFKWKNGRVFKGPFKDGKPNGKGVLLVEGCTIEDAEFVNGKFIGDLNSKIKSIKGES